MTHAELTSNARQFASVCPGELASQGEFPDETVTAGANTLNIVTVWICRGCGWCLTSMESSAGVKVLNAYKPPKPLEVRDR